MRRQIVLFLLFESIPIDITTSQLLPSLTYITSRRHIFYFLIYAYLVYDNDEKLYVYKFYPDPDVKINEDPSFLEHSIRNSRFIRSFSL